MEHSDRENAKQAIEEVHKKYKPQAQASTAPKSRGPRNKADVKPEPDEEDGKALVPCHVRQLIGLAQMFQITSAYSPVTYPMRSLRSRGGPSSCTGG